MGNWMEKYERRNDEKRERELNARLENLLVSLDESFDNKARVKILKEIVEVYDELRIDACDYDQRDFEAKKCELDRLRYEIMEKAHMEDKDSQSWNDYRSEELEEEDFER